MSDAEVARRAGLGERRYAHYVTGKREPDLATLLRISQVLGATPNQLLGWEELTAPTNERHALLERLHSALTPLNEDDFRIVVAAVEAIAVLRQQ